MCATRRCPRFRCWRLRWLRSMLEDLRNCQFVGHRWEDSSLGTGITLRRSAGVLRNVSASRELLFVGVLGYVQSVSCETGSVPDQTVLLGHQSRNFSRDDFVRYRVLGVSVELVGVRDVPSPDRLVITDASSHGLEGRFLGHESVAVSVLLTSDW